MKKWLCLLVAIGLFAVPVRADDDEWEEEEEYEEEAPKKASKKAAAPKKAKEAGDSRMGFAVGLNGGQGSMNFVYDMGTGIEIGIGLGLYRRQHGEEDPSQTIHVIPGVSYSLGKSPLDYGLGVDATITMLPDDGGTEMTGFPYFYAKAELVKNVHLKLATGLNVYMSAADEQENKTMIMEFRTAGSLIFYFM